MNHLVLFDIDNTLVQSSSGHMQALLETIKDVYRIEANIGVINHHGMTDQEIITRILGKYDVDTKTIQSNLKECIKRMPLKYEKIVASENIIILQGVYDLLTSIDQLGLLIGLVTGNVEKIAHAKLKKIGIDHFFKIGGFGSDHINRANLVKIAIKRAADRIGIATAGNIFLFGDAPQDMRAANEAGATPIGVTTGIFSAEQLEAAGARKIVPDLTHVDHITEFLLRFSEMKK